MSLNMILNERISDKTDKKKNTYTAMKIKKVITFLSASLSVLLADRNWKYISRKLTVKGKFEIREQK